MILPGCGLCEDREAADEWMLVGDFPLPARLCDTHRAYCLGRVTAHLGGMNGDLWASMLSDEEQRAWDEERRAWEARHPL